MKEIYLNLVVNNLTVSTKFYEALGFKVNPQFSNDQASGMVWGDNIYVMLLTKDFAKNFAPEGKEFGDFKKIVSPFIALTLGSREEVDAFAAAADANGGHAYVVPMNNQFEWMYGKEVEDPDGYILEPFFMDVSKFPAQPVDAHVNASEPTSESVTEEVAK